MTAAVLVAVNDTEWRRGCLAGTIAVAVMAAGIVVVWQQGADTDSL
jgi:hypothetical protein